MEPAFATTRLSSAAVVVVGATPPGWTGWMSQPARARRRGARARATRRNTRPGYGRNATVVRNARLALIARRAARRRPGGTPATSGRAVDRAGDRLHRGGHDVGVEPDA